MLQIQGEKDRCFTPSNYCFFLKKNFFNLFLERGEGKEKERETSMCGCLSSAPHWGPGLYNPGIAPLGNQTGNHLACRPALNPLSYTSQALLAFKGGKHKGLNLCRLNAQISCTLSKSPMDTNFAYSFI